MSDKYICSGWACQDCLILLANGDTPPEMNEAETAAWLAEIDRRDDGLDITLGMPREDHACTEDFDGKTAGEAGADCDCEIDHFSWSACDVCGSTLGGERHAVSFFKRS